MPTSSMSGLRKMLPILKYELALHRHKLGLEPCFAFCSLEIGRISFLSGSAELQMVTSGLQRNVPPPRANSPPPQVLGPR